MNLSRRSIIAHATGAAAVGIASTNVASAGRMSGAAQGLSASGRVSSGREQVAGVYRHKVGDTLLTSVSDGANSFPRQDGFASNVSADRVAQALRDAFLPTDRITLTFTPAALETRGKLVVVDTGLGEAAYRSSGGVGGQFHTNLRAAGYSPEAVDLVLITHFHADHIGGLLTADGKSAFPRARILVPEAEHAFWLDKTLAAQAATDTIKANFARAQRVMGILANQVDLFRPDQEVAPGVTSIATPGHTPGHTSFQITSGADTAIIQGDATTHPALFLERPDWHSWSDMDPELAERSRRALYDRAAAGKTLIQGFHFSFPALGHLAKDGNGYKYVPIHWSPTL